MDSSPEVSHNLFIYFVPEQMVPWGKSQVTPGGMSLWLRPACCIKESGTNGLSAALGTCFQSHTFPGSVSASD